MKPTWSVTGAPCSAGERTLGNIVKRECLTRTGRESREGSCGALGGSRGRESRSGETWEGRPGTAQRGRGLAVGNAGQGMVLLGWNRVPGRQISLGTCSWNQVRVGLERPAQYF